MIYKVCTVAAINRSISKNTVIPRVRYERHLEDVFVWSSDRLDYIGEKTKQSLATLIRKECDFDEIKNAPLISAIVTDESNI